MSIIPEALASICPWKESKEMKNIGKLRVKCTDLNKPALCTLKKTNEVESMTNPFGKGQV